MNGTAHPGPREDKRLKQYTGSLQSELCTREDAERNKEESDVLVLCELVKHDCAGQESPAVELNLAIDWHRCHRRCSDSVGREASRDVIDRVIVDRTR